MLPAKDLAYIYMVKFLVLGSSFSRKYLKSLDEFYLIKAIDRSHYIEMLVYSYAESA